MCKKIHFVGLLCASPVQICSFLKLKNKRILRNTSIQLFLVTSCSKNSFYLNWRTSNTEQILQFLFVNSQAFFQFRKGQICISKVANVFCLSVRYFFTKVLICCYVVLFICRLCNSHTELIVLQWNRVSMRLSSAFEPSFFSYIYFQNLLLLHHHVGKTYCQFLRRCSENIKPGIGFLKRIPIISAKAYKCEYVKLANEPAQHMKLSTFSWLSF